MIDLVRKQFTALLQQQGLELKDDQWQQFELYCDELVSWNQKMNLTAIKDKQQIFIKHFYDSISLSFFYPLSAVKTVADIGSGAGFPSIPLKIMYPHLHITLIDSLRKRIQFLDHLCRVLQLTDVQLLHSRAEDAARDHQYRDQFDLVTARAVARLNVLNELCLPFVKVGGTFIAMKGSKSEEELSEAEASIKLLQAQLESVQSFSLPPDQAQRQIILIKKRGKTPNQYPRKAGVPAKSPLV